MRRFNTTGLCMPESDYMVDISGRVAQIRVMVERGDYFCINRARQYGKTTTLAALERALSGDFAVASLDFQALGHASFSTEGRFARGLSRMLARAVDLPPCAAEEIGAMARRDVSDLTLEDLFFALSDWCEESDRPVVLIVDEVDSATSNQVFLDFLAQLRLQKESLEQQLIDQVRRQVGSAHVVLGLSGGVDSSVCAALLAKAIFRSSQNAKK